MQRMKLEVRIARETMPDGEHETLLFRTRVDGLTNHILPLCRAGFQCYDRL